MPAANSPWTAERVARLRELWDQRALASEIAEEFGTTRSAVLGKAWRLCLADHSRGSAGEPVPRRNPPPARTPPMPPIVPQIPQIPQIKQVSQTPQMPRLRLVDLRDGYCRWPYGDVWQGGVYFCGDTTDGHVYCPHHKAKAYVSQRKAG